MVFPEYFTDQLMSIPANGKPCGTIHDLARYAGRYVALFSELARRYTIWIVAGTQIVQEGNRLYNTAHPCHPDGRIDTQRKLHLTATERGPWEFRPARS